MGIILDALNRAAHQSMINEAFRRGQNGDPPLVSMYANLQPLYDKAYEQGRQSVLNKAVKALTDKLTD